MSEQDFGSTPPAPEAPQPEAAWGTPTPNYAQPPYTPPPPGYVPPTAAAPGLSENAASLLAYITFIPALIFLLLAPYNQSPRVKFHAIQELGLTVVWMCLGIIGIIPFLGWIVLLLGGLAMVVLWILCIVKASQGGVFKLPIIGDFAAQQAGYTL